MNSTGEYKIGRLQFDEKSIRIAVDKFGDERFRIYALEGKQTIPLDPYAIRTNGPSYISFCIHDHTLKFSGIYVAPHLRGTLISDYLISLLFDISQQLNISLSETAVIRKPLIAKKLIEWGFTAKNFDTQVELTGHSQGVLKTPIVKSVQDISGKLKHNISRLSQNVFYILGKEEGIGEVVPIHTQFLFQNIQKSDEKIQKLSCEIVGKRRFYKGAVRKILGN